MQLEMAVGIVIGWTAVSVLTALGWSRFATRIRRREQQLVGGPHAAQPGAETAATSERSKGADSDRAQLPRSA